MNFQFEQLEERLLLAAQIKTSGSTLKIIGDDGQDLIAIVGTGAENQVEVFVDQNGDGEFSANESQGLFTVKKINVNTKGGNDVVMVQNVRLEKHLTVKLGKGDDAYVGEGNVISGKTLINGQQGNDSYIDRGAEDNDPSTLPSTSGAGLKIRKIENGNDPGILFPNATPGGDGTGGDGTGGDGTGGDGTGGDGTGGDGTGGDGTGGDGTGGDGTGGDGTGGDGTGGDDDDDEELLLAEDDLLVTDEDTPVGVLADGVTTSLLSNDVAGTSIVEVISGGVTSPVDGTITLASGARLTLGGDGTFLYDPAGSFDALANGATATDSFSYVVEDSDGNRDTATVTVTITGVDDSAEASGIADRLVFENDAPPQGGKLVQDIDSAIEVLDVQAEDGAGGAAVVTVNGDGSFTFRTFDDTEVTVYADGSFTTDTRTSTLAHGQALIVPISLTLQETGGTPTLQTQLIVLGANDGGPTGVDDSFDAAEDQVTLNLGNVLANDTDPDNDVLFVSEVNGLASGIGSAVAGDNGGLFTIHADGTVDFDSTGIDLAGGTTQQTSISYTVNDGNGGTDTATLTVTIVGANNAPEAADDLAAVVGEDSGNVVVYSDITANDDDLEGDSLTVTRIGLPGGPTQTVAPGGTTIAGDAGGLFTVFPNGEVQFDPNGEFENLDVGDSASTRISYIVSDGHGGTSTAIVTVTVEGADDPAVGLAVTSAESDVVDIVTVVDDPDGPVVLKSVVGVTESRNATIATPVAVTDLGNGTYQLTTVDGTEITLNADGTAAVNSGSTDLSLGESNVITLTLMVNDGTGGESDQEVTATITLVGGNDNPIAVSDTATPNALALVAMQLSPTYVGNVLTGAVDASFAGMSADHDPDALDTLKVVGVGVSGSGMITDGTGVGTAVTVDGVQITISDTGEVTAYVVTLNLAPAVTVDYTISDGKGGFAVAQLTLSGLTVL